MRLSLCVQFSISQMGLDRLTLVFTYSLQALRYVRPPDSLLAQLDVYTEEKFEDEEEMRERALAFTRTHPDEPERAMGGHHGREVSESQEAFRELVTLAKKDGDVYPLMVETLRSYAKILERDVDR